MTNDESGRSDRRLPGESRRSAGIRIIVAFAFLAATAALTAVDFGPNDDVLVGIVFFGAGVLAGLLIGEWWSVLLALIWYPIVVVAPDSEAGVSGSLLLATIINVPLQAVSLAVGVLFGKAGRIALSEDPGVEKTSGASRS